MVSHIVETVEIVNKDGDTTVIRKSDFDPKKHKLVPKKKTSKEE